MERSALQPGGLLDRRYRLERVIGAGGMATVWLATDERLGRKVAIKALSDALATDPAYVARFEREARIAAGLSHPNLVEVLDSGAAGEQPYLVMEYVDGPTLADALQRDPGGVDTEQLARELLGALRHIHAAGVVHRDVKPANVLIGADGRARLTDFGIARPEEGTQITQTGQMVGTLQYMAPELIEGKPASERSDLYSCGVLLKECAGGSQEGDVGRLVKRLTARRPRRRPASAQAALGWLGAAAQPTQPEPAPTQVLPQGDDEAPVLPQGDDEAPTEAISETPEPEPAPTRRRKLLLGLAAAAAIAAGLLLALNLDGGDSGGQRQAAERGGAGGGAQAAASGVRSGEAKGPCSVLEGQRTALRAQRKVALEGLTGNDPDTRRQAQQYFQARDETLAVALASCRERGSGEGTPAPASGGAATSGPASATPAPAEAKPNKGQKPGKGPKKEKGKPEAKGKPSKAGKGHGGKG
jgi:hypothetical protein